MRFVVAGLCWMLLAQVVQPVPQDPELVRRVGVAIAPLLDTSPEKRNRFTYFVEQHDRWRADGDGPWSERTTLAEITFIGDLPYRRLIEVDGTPLTGKAAEDEKNRYDAALKAHAAYGIIEHAKAEKKQMLVTKIPLEDLTTRYRLAVVRHGTARETPVGAAADVIDAAPASPEEPKAPIQHMKLWLGGETLLRIENQYTKDDGEVLAGSSGEASYMLVDGTLVISHSIDRLTMKTARGRYQMMSEVTYTRYRRFAVATRILP